jgi:ankyrin repeat protein
LAGVTPKRCRHDRRLGRRWRRRQCRNAPGTETPLHWAASSDDIEALDALVDAGADVDAPGAVIAGGTPLDDAVAFGQWEAARRLVHPGARTGGGKER